MKLSNVLFATAILTFVGFASCKKNDKEILSISDYKLLVQDEAQVSDMMDDIDNEADDAMNTSGGLVKSTLADDTTALAGREVVWSINLNGTRKAVVTFTNFSNPKARKEKVKNGKIIIEVTGSRLLNTYKRVITFEDFTINGNKIEGTKTIEKTEALKFKITLANGKITFTDGKTMTHNFTRTRTMTKGIETPFYIWDDEYTFEGSAYGVNKKEISYTKEITKPITILTRYNFPVSGSFDLTVDGVTMSLDYGDGTLDTKATVTINGASQEINLSK